MKSAWRNSVLALDHIPENDCENETVASESSYAVLDYESYTNEENDQPPNPGDFSSEGGRSRSSRKSAPLRDSNLAQTEIGQLITKILQEADKVPEAVGRIESYLRVKERNFDVPWKIKKPPITKTFFERHSNALLFRGMEVNQPAEDSPYVLSSEQIKGTPSADDSSGIESILYNCLLRLKVKKPNEALDETSWLNFTEQFLKKIFWDLYVLYERVIKSSCRDNFKEKMIKIQSAKISIDDKCSSVVPKELDFADAVHEAQQFLNDEIIRELKMEIEFNFIDMGGKSLNYSIVWSFPGSFNMAANRGRIMVKDRHNDPKYKKRNELNAEAIITHGLKEALLGLFKKNNTD